MRIVFSIITLLFCALTADAQTFLDALRKTETGRGKVTVIQSDAIDSLVNGTTQQKNTPVSNSNTTQHQGTTTQLVPPPTQTKPTEPAPKEHISNTTTTSENPDMEPVVDTRKKVMRNSYKTQGYRIQVFSGGNSRIDRQKAETAGAVMKSNFPKEPIYVHFYSPSWKCRMGNYKTVEEARALLAKVKKLGYNQACIVKGTISVQY